MERDLRKGRSEWAGCYNFRDIICDGDPSSVGEKRDGALKMGGTYWYYVRKIHAPVNAVRRADLGST